MYDQSYHGGGGGRVLAQHFGDGVPTPHNTDTGKVETYTGLTGGTLKTRFSLRMSDFLNPDYEHEHSTPLSKYIWSLNHPNILGYSLQGQGLQPSD